MADKSLRSMDEIRYALKELRGGADYLGRHEAWGKMLEAIDELELLRSGDEEARLRAILQKVGALPTNWRCRSLDFPVDGPALYPGVLMACAEELERTLTPDGVREGKPVE